MITVDFNRLGYQNGTKILDIGCGSGRHMGAAVRHKEIFAVGTDPAFGNLKETAHRLVFQEKFGEGGGNWGLCASDITCLPFADQSFDSVICAEVLELAQQSGCTIVDYPETSNGRSNACGKECRW